MSWRREAPGVAGLILFLTAATWISATRHFYDDEIASIGIVSGRGLFELFVSINSSDVHPPLGYLVNRLFWLEQYPRLLFLPGVLLNAGAAVYFFRSASGSLKSRSALVSLFFLTFLNSELLMWGVSVRWYSVFLPLSLVLLTTLILQEVKLWTIYFASLLLVVLTYTSYLTFLLLPIAYGLLWLRGARYRTRHLLTSVLFYFACTAYQYWIFITVHSHNSEHQQSSLLKALVYTMIGVVNGSTTFPLEPLALLKHLAVVSVAALAAFRWKRDSRAPASSIVILTVVGLSVVLLAASGLGGKMRNSSFLNIWFGLLIALCTAGTPGWLRLGCVLGILGFSTLSTYNLLSGTGTLKDRYNFPVKQILQFVDDYHRRAQPGNTVVYTYDPTIAFELARRGVHCFCPFSDTISAPVPGKQGDCVVFLDNEKGNLSEEEYTAVQQRKSDIVRQSELVEGPIGMGHNKWYRVKARLSQRAFREYYVDVTVVRLLVDVSLLPYSDGKGGVGVSNGQERD